MNKKEVIVAIHYENNGNAILVSRERIVSEVIYWFNERKHWKDDLGRHYVNHPLEYLDEGKQCSFDMFGYCPNTGQKIDWEEIKEEVKNKLKDVMSNSNREIMTYVLQDLHSYLSQNVIAIDEFNSDNQIIKTIYYKLMPDGLGYLHNGYFKLTIKYSKSGRSIKNKVVSVSREDMQDMLLKKINKHKVRQIHISDIKEELNNSVTEYIDDILDFHDICKK